MDAASACALLARVPGLTAEQLRTALAEAGSLERVARGEAAAVDRWSAPARRFLTHPPEALIAADVRWAAREGATLLPANDSRYPAQLAAIAGAPAVLYVLGDTLALGQPQLAVVGARSATPAGLRHAHELAAGLAGGGLAITSGLALGIDSAAHAGALAAGGTTIAVCAHGLDRIYPRRNRRLADRIRRSGALVSRLPPGSPPRRAFFPQRNQLISGLALGTLVVEAARDSGSLITARYARQQSRAVFAVPGSIANPLARGCHQLIREGATLVESAAEVLSVLGIPPRRLGNSEPDQHVDRGAGTPADVGGTGPPLDKAYEMLLDALGFEPVSINTLVERTGLPSGSIASMLLILELGRRVAPYPGGCYCRLT